MAGRPLIGICAACEQARWGAWDIRADLLPRMYVEAVQHAGGAAVLLPVDPQWAEDPHGVLAKLDGLLLAGGVDVDPASYHAAAHAETGGCSIVRDAAELALIDAALKNRRPLLGICRGMQLINVLFGGTLIQHLPDVTERSHLVTPGSFAGSEHPLVVEPQTLIAEILGELHLSVNSHHHQAVGELGDGLVVTARSDDGVVEALELVEPQAFALGVQWHPEADDADRVIAAFIAAASA